MGTNRVERHGGKTMRIARIKRVRFLSFHFRCVILVPRMNHLKPGIMEKQDITPESGQESREGSGVSRKPYTWADFNRDCEKMYARLVELGMKPEEDRSILDRRMAELSKFDVKMYPTSLSETLKRDPEEKKKE